MMHRIRLALADPAFDRKLGGGNGSDDPGVVETDETYIGVKTRGKEPGCRGNKTAVVTLVERNGDASSRPMLKVTGRNLDAVLAGNIDTSARLMTDEHPG